MPASAVPVCRPVIIGMDIGVYALARAMHEAYGVRSTAITRMGTGPINHSDILELVQLGDTFSDAAILVALLDLADRHDGPEPLLLLANGDSWTQLMHQHRVVLAKHYLFAIPDESALRAVADKGLFAQVCDELDLPSPVTQVLDLAGSGASGWAPPAIQLPFPMVAKAASGAESERLNFPGKKKVHYLQSRDELDWLVGALREAGFAGRYVLQELIPGDDTAMRSVTAYVDQHGEVTLLGSARVLVEEHDPAALGNPAAMITEPYPELYAASARLLAHLGYRGFANLDVKVDPRDGVAKFFEVNPRIGRNNYYVTAAGANVAEVTVEDLVLGRRAELRTATAEVLYSVLPLRLLLRYVREPALRARVRRLAPGAVHPLGYERRNLRRRSYLLANGLNHLRKFARYYPRPTESGF